MMKQVSYPSRGQRVFGYAHVPAARAAAPAILLCHGFTGNGIEESRLFVDFARAACEQGFYVLRIDFVGSGNSDADFAEYTHLDGWVEDALGGVAFLAEQPEVDAKRIGALGISLGAATAILAGQRKCLAAVAGWAAVIEPEATFRRILTDGNWELLARGNRRIAHVYGGHKFSITSRFVEDAQKLSVYAAAAQYGEKPLLLLQGEDDAVIDITHSVKLKSMAQGHVEHHYIRGEDHSFTQHRDSNIERTIDFFRRVL